MDTYQPQVLPTGQVTQYVPRDFPQINPAGVETPNPTLSPLNQPYQSLPQTGSFLGTLNAPGGGSYPSFTFDFAAEQQKAYEQLRPFYEKVIEFAQGDLNLAKRIIDYTYESGIRQARTDHEIEARQQAIEFPQEKERLQTEQNRRGVLESGFGKTDRTRMLDSQTIRREAIDRALQQRESSLSADRGYNLEKEQRGFQEDLFNKERERRQESSELASAKYGIKSTQYGVEVAKAQFAEQQRAQKEALAGTGSFASGGGSGESAEDQWRRLHPNEGPKPEGYHGE